MRLRPASEACWHIRVEMLEDKASGPSLEWRTAYPLELIREILNVKGAGWLCDEIKRDEDPDYLERAFSRQLLAFVDPAALVGKRILDFGCGSGASSLVLSRLFPDSEIIGTEFNAAFARLARMRVAHHKAQRITILEQEDPLQLPDIPVVELIVLSAVVEHMLPDERRRILPALWNGLSTGGYVFVCDTPHRWFPIEAHTTGLIGLNYQSDRAAHRRTVQLNRSDLGRSWSELLRAGIRGSTEREIIDHLTARQRSRAEIVPPTRPTRRTRADLWFEGLTPGRRRFTKAGVRIALNLFERITGTLPTQNITLCLRKTS